MYGHVNTSLQKINDCDYTVIKLKTIKLNTYTVLIINIPSKNNYF